MKNKVIVKILILDDIYMVASRVLCKNTIHLRKQTEAVIDEGGEGVILRQITII